MSGRSFAFSLLAALALAAPLHAADVPANARVEQDTLVLSAPPRDTEAEGHRIFDPLADYLSAVLGKKVVYRHPTTWGGYQSDMQAGAYDIVFDGPHFNSWRIAKRGHSALVKIPGDFVYTAIVRSDNTKATTLKRLAGHKICAHAPPNLGTLIMYNEFDNPARQPVVIVRHGYKEIYNAVLNGECEAAMLPLGHLVKYEKEQATPRTRVIFRTRAMPQQAFSAGPRLTADQRTKIAEALLAPAGAAALSNFRKTYGFAGQFVRARDGEYGGLSNYLKNEWGYF